MNTNTAASKGRAHSVVNNYGLVFWLLMCMTLAALFPSVAAPVVGSWTPHFKGVDFSVSTNLGGGDLPNRQVVSALRVDLTEPDIRLLTTPQLTEYVANAEEVGGLTVSDFLLTYGLQAAINANFFNRGSYYLPAGTPMDVYGLAVSEGVVVSTQDSRSHAAAILFDAQNHPTVLHTNWPAASEEGIYTAVAGNYPLVVSGTNAISRARAQETEPRTLFGVSEDRRYLYVVAIDGRQPGYSDGANDYESAEWLLLLGAHDGVNMDGGGSTTLVVQDTTGVAVRLNSSSAVADSGRERTIGSHFGLYAKPLPGFINDVAVATDETTATISWTTVEPATSQVEYGPSLNFGSSSPVSESLATEHAVPLSGLVPNARYYFRALSGNAAGQQISSNYVFRTVHHVTTNEIFAVTQSWKYTTAPQATLAWAAPDYDDSSWAGPGPGLFWVNTRADRPVEAVQPKSTEVSWDPVTGFPYITYYFRTEFELTDLVAGTALRFVSFVDDGAVFYLNGAEVSRLRVPPDATNDTLASGYPCEGDATCPDEFVLEAGAAAQLRLGNNVLAAEVHNYNPRSADMTFGVALSRVEPVSRPATVQFRYAANQLTLTWTAPGFTLQSASSPAGPWEDISAASPFSTALSEAHRYFRLRR